MIAHVINDTLHWSWDPSEVRITPLRHEVQFLKETSQELRMLSSVTLNCQATKIVMHSGSRLLTL